jgi:hypothetical protein
MYSQIFTWYYSVIKLLNRNKKLLASGLIYPHKDFSLMMNYYELLEVHKKATDEEISLAYATRISMLDPKKDFDKITELNIALAILTQTKDRKKYDEGLQQEHNTNVDYYTILELPRNATKEEIAEKEAILVSTLEAAKDKDLELRALYEKIFGVLKDSQERDKYNKKIGVSAQEASNITNNNSSKSPSPEENCSNALERLQQLPNPWMPPLSKPAVYVPPFVQKEEIREEVEKCIQFINESGNETITAEAAKRFVEELKYIKEPDTHWNIINLALSHIKYSNKATYSDSYVATPLLDRPSAPRQELVALGFSLTELILGADRWTVHVLFKYLPELHFLSQERLETIRQKLATLKGVELDTTLQKEIKAAKKVVPFCSMPIYKSDLGRFLQQRPVVKDTPNADVQKKGASSLMETAGSTSPRRSPRL